MSGSNRALVAVIGEPASIVDHKAGLAGEESAVKGASS